MLLIFPTVFLVVGLGLGCGLVFINVRTRSHMRSIEQATLCKAGSLISGPVKLEGVAKAVDPNALLISPIEQKPCVYFHLVIEQWQNAAIQTSASVRRGPGSGSWTPVVEDIQAIPMVVADETGEVAIDLKQAKLDLKAKRKHANFLNQLPKDLEQSLRDRYKIVTKTWFLPKQMRYTELVIAQDAEVFVFGDCEVKDGKATFDNSHQPVHLSFRNEKTVLRNGKIVTWVTGVGAVVVPIAFLLLAWFIYATSSAQFKPMNQPNQPVAGKQNNPKVPGKAPGKH
jgi:hypothetical protein